MGASQPDCQYIQTIMQIYIVLDSLGQATIPQTPQRAADASGTKHGCMGYIDETE